jgi:hypothetical protein
MQLDPQTELNLLSPSPLLVEGREVFSPSVAQVIGYLARRREREEILSFLSKEHGTRHARLIDLYEGSVKLFFNKEEQEKKEKPASLAWGETRAHEISITRRLYSVMKVFKVSWQEVLDMSVAHFHLCFELSQKEKLEEAKKIHDLKGHSKR